MNFYISFYYFYYKKKYLKLVYNMKYLVNDFGGNFMIIIIGLGNPGLRYENTKHNIGFKVIDKIANDYNININKFKYKALVGDGFIKNKRVLLVKPQTYMNLSGESVKEILNFYKLSYENIIVIYDDISLDIGAVRIRRKGSAGGHNGIKNIISKLDTDTFLRIKIGIGDKPSNWDLADYVLSDFTEDEKISLSYGIDKAVDAINIIFSDSVDKAMNKINKK